MPSAAHSKPTPSAGRKAEKKKFIALAALITSTPFLVAIAIHILLLLIGGGMVISKGGSPLAIFTSQDGVEGDAGMEAEAPPSPEESTTQPEAEPMAMETEVVPTEVEQSSDILALATPTVVPSFAPTMPAKSTGTTMTGSSGGGRGGAGAGGPKKKARSGKSTLFGFEEAMEDDLIGTMIDLKQDATGKKPTGMGTSDTDFYRAARELLAGQRVNEGALRKYFVVPKKLGATQVFIPTCDASEAPKVFGVADKVKPNYWLIRYQGRFAAPVSGQYRFVGKADDLLWVAVEGRTVLEAHWDVDNFLTNWRPKDHVREHSVYDFMGGNTEGDRARAFLTYGDWMSLEAGKPKDLEILLGEYGGGRFFAILMIQSRGQEEEFGKSKERPLIPLFVTAEPSGQQRQAMRASKLEFPRELPVFAASQIPGSADTMAPSPETRPVPSPPTTGRMDTAAASTYGSGWKDGSGNSDDWEAWTLRANDNPDGKSYAGFYLARQEEKSGSEPVSLEGKSFAIYADGVGFQESAAFRGFSKPLQIQQTFSLDILTPLPKSNSGTSGSIGLTLRSGNQNERPEDYNAGSRFEFTALEGKANYQIYDGSPSPESGLAVTPGGIRLEFTLRSADTYDLNLYPLSGGEPVLLKDRRLGGPAGTQLESLAIFNRDSEQNVFFNRLRLSP